jgi:small subunit ribosomal protein S16
VGGRARETLLAGGGSIAVVFAKESSVAVRIRMKKMGRTHRPFFRICAIDKRSPRDGRVLEELGTYDPSITDTDARAVLKKERVDYWLSVGAQPSDKVAVLIKKYGTNGTHAEAQSSALDRLATPRAIPDPGPAASKAGQDQPAENPAAEPPAAEAPPAEEPSSAPATAEAAPAESTEAESSAESAAQPPQA